MLEPKLRLILWGCAAVAIGVVGGRTALALFTPPAPADSEIVKTAPPELATAPAPAAPEPSPAPPASIAAPAPPASVTAKPGIIERNVAATGPTGVWIDHTGRGAVEISECAGGLCGKIVWLKDAGHTSVCGTQIIGNAKRTSAGTWDGGWILDPEKNARYSVELKLVGSDKLRVMGYMGSKLFSESFIWRRPSTDLVRCDTSPATASPSSTDAPKTASPNEITKTEPTPDQTPGPAAADKHSKSVNPSFADLEKAARELMKGKAGGKECTVKLPYVGNVTIPCPG